MHILIFNFDSFSFSLFLAISPFSFISHAHSFFLIMLEEHKAELPSLAKELVNVALL